MSDTPSVVWLSAGIREKILVDVALTAPKETGGIFLGYWADDATAVITDVVGAGANALHKMDSFEPDHDWQSKQIALLYEESGRRLEYLGDWHSHPNSRKARLSFRDKRVLKRIAQHKPARSPHPLMGIVYGETEDFQIAIFCGRIATHFGIINWMSVANCTVKRETEPRQQLDLLDQE